MKQIKELKRGEFFTRKPIDLPKENQVYIKGDYDRGTRSYTCTRFDDVCRSINLPGDKEIYTDFVF